MITHQVPQCTTGSLLGHLVIMDQIRRCLYNLQHDSETIRRRIDSRSVIGGNESQIRLPCLRIDQWCRCEKRYKFTWAKVF